jgi:hypothetical protein
VRKKERKKERTKEQKKERNIPVRKKERNIPVRKKEKKELYLGLLLLPADAADPVLVPRFSRDERRCLLLLLDDDDTDDHKSLALATVMTTVLG